jgi:hypothetical protein
MAKAVTPLWFWEEDFDVPGWWEIDEEVGPGAQVQVVARVYWMR